MTRRLIVNLEPEGYSDAARATLQSVADVQDLEGFHDRRDRDALIADADVIITRLATYIDDAFLSQTKKLRAIATATTGLTHIDLAAAEAHDVRVISLRGEEDFLSRITATAELHWGLLIAICRHMPGAISAVRNGTWDRDRFQGMQLRGKTVGILGYGRLGRIIARYAQAFEMPVLAYDRNQRQSDGLVQSVDLPSLLARSDILSINLSLNDESENFLDRERLEQVRQGALIVNTARGEIVDETALAELIRDGHIAGYATDVLRGELTDPGFPADNPLWELSRRNDRVIVTPHIGGACPDAMRATEEFIADKIVHFLRED